MNNNAVNYFLRIYLWLHHIMLIINITILPVLLYLFIILFIILNPQPLNLCIIKTVFTLLLYITCLYCIIRSSQATKRKINNTQISPFEKLFIFFSSIIIPLEILFMLALSYIAINSKLQF